MDVFAANKCLFKRAECEAAKNHTRLFIVATGDTCPTPKTVSTLIRTFTLCLSASASPYLSLFSFSLCGFLFFYHLLSLCLSLFSLSLSFNFSILYCLNQCLSLFSLSLSVFFPFLSSIVCMSVTVIALSFCLFIFLSSIVSVSVCLCSRSLFLSGF